MNLIIAPHIDDEIIGCGGFISQSNDDLLVYFCGVDKFHIISQADRLKEAQAVSTFLGFQVEVNLYSIVNAYKTIDFIDVFQEVINRVKPEKVFIPYPSYNQDHQAIYHAAMIALRPHDKNHFVKKVLTYEGMGAIQWMNNEYKPNYFVPIDIEAKIKAYLMHNSQVRGHRSPIQIRALAVLRGSQISEPHAEAFIIERWVD